MPHWPVICRGNISERGLACEHTRRSCEFCRRGHFNLCPNVEFTGAPPFHGAPTRRMVVAEKQLFPMPKNLNAVEAMMMEPLGVTIPAIDIRLAGAILYSKR